MRAQQKTGSIRHIDESGLELAPQLRHMQLRHMQLRHIEKDELPCLGTQDTTARLNGVLRLRAAVSPQRDVPTRAGQLFFSPSRSHCLSGRSMPVTVATLSRQRRSSPRLILRLRPRMRRSPHIGRPSPDLPILDPPITGSARLRSSTEQPVYGGAHTRREHSLSVSHRPQPLLRTRKCWWPPSRQLAAEPSRAVVRRPGECTPPRAGIQ